MHPELIRTAKLTQQTIDDWKTQAGKEKDIIKVQLMRGVFGINNERSLELYVQNCQQCLINLADEVTEYAGHFARKSRQAGLYQFMLLIVESLLTYIEQHCSRYFNIDAKVPDSYYKVEHTENKKKVEKINRVLEIQNINKSLLEILFQTFTSFIQEKNNTGITYRKLIYFKELLNEINALANNTLIEKSTNELVNLLLYLNFNHVLFFNFYINIICSELENMNSIAERIEKLSFHVKQLNQFHYRPGVSLFNDYPHIKDQVSGWLTEEIYFLEKKNQLSISVMMPKNNNEKLEPLFTSLSVPQLGFFIKLLVDTGVVNNKNQTELLKTITKTIRTHRNETISLDSLRNKYYNVDKSTTETVKDKLFNMINQTKKYS